MTVSTTTDASAPDAASTATAAPAPTVAGAPSAALTPDQLAQITDAQRDGRVVRRAAIVATFSGWSIAIFGALTMLTGLMDVETLGIGIVLGVIGMIELHGSRRVRRLDSTAPRLLALNQAALGVVLIAWCIGRVVTALTGPAYFDDAGLDPASPVAGALEPWNDLVQNVIVLVYSIVAVGVLGIQSGMVLYYATRRRAILAMTERHPAWVLEVLRRTQ